MNNDQPTQSSSWIRRHPMRTGALALLLFILFVDGIAGWTLIPPREPTSRQYHSYYHHGFLPNARDAEVWGPDRTYEIFTDALGLRCSAARSSIPAAGTSRTVLVLGDSFVEGVGVQYERTFVGILANTLKKQKGFTVLNGGVASYGATLYLAKLRFLLEQKDVHPSDLLVFIDLSDPYNDLFLKDFERFTPSPEETALHLFARSMNRFLDDHSYIVHSFNIIYPYIKYRKYERGFPWWTLKEEVFDDWGRKALGITMARMQDLADYCRSNDIALTLAVYPWPHQIEHRDLDSRQVRVWSEFARSNNAGFINFFPDFINDIPADTILQRYFIDDDIHWNEAGHALIAEKLLQRLRYRPSSPRTSTH